MSQAVSEFRVERAVELQEGTAAARRHNPETGPEDANAKARHTGTHLLFNRILIIFVALLFKTMRAATKEQYRNLNPCDGRGR